jgi:hypothetical protein
MAHILVRKYGSGVTRYTANTHRAAAEKWAKSREVTLEDPAALIRAGHGAPSLAELIRWYIDSFEKISKWQRSKQTHLEFLERHSIGKSNALALTPAILIDHIRPFL